MRDVRYKMSYIRFWITVVFILSAFSFQFSTVLFAQETVTEEPILITSDQVEYLDKKKEGEFIGNVKAIQGKMTLTSSKIKVILEPDGKKIRQIVATGKVKIVQEDLVATSEQAFFYNDEQKIILTGSPQAFSRNNKFSGEKVTIFLKENRIIIETKVKGIIVQE
jgi:lipopolysaccharide export system protein LptA